MRVSDAVIIPSEVYEVFPRSVTESFSLGIPVIASNIGNHVKRWRNYISNDYASFIQAIDIVIKNKDVYKKNAIHYYKEYLTEEKNYLALDTIYHRVKPFPERQ